MTQADYFYFSEAQKKYRESMKDTIAQWKDCPFCGSAEKYPRKVFCQWTIECYRCQTRGPLCNTKEDAIKRWNERI